VARPFPGFFGPWQVLDAHEFPTWVLALLRTVRPIGSPHHMVSVPVFGPFPPIIFPLINWRGFFFVLGNQNGGLGSGTTGVTVEGSWSPIFNHRFCSRLQHAIWSIFPGQKRVGKGTPRLTVDPAMG